MMLDNSETGGLAEPPAPAEHLAAKRENKTYGSFRIGAMEFALPVEVVREVVTEPKELTQVPMATPHLVGLFTLREMIVPLIDLRQLLELPPREEIAEGKIAIIENGNLSIGLLFDETGEIIHSEHAKRLNFQPNSNGVKDIVVEGVLKFDDGRRSVQILDPYELLKLEKLPRISKKENTTKIESDLGERLSCVSFELGHTTCAIDTRFVQEVMDVPEVEDFVLKSGHVLGAINLRGRTLPVIDFRGEFGREEPFAFEQSALKNRKLLVMNLPEGPLALLVYAIDSIINYFDRDVLPFAKVALPRHDIVKGCLVSGNEEIIILIDGDKLKNDKELVRVARSCQEIHPPETLEKETKEVGKESTRRTFILYSVGHSFALDVTCVSEVIDRPPKLLAPPYSLSFVEGILNLRGELITIINPRLLYGIGEAKASAPKVLIFFHEGQKYGMLVDSVDEIVMTNDAAVVETPTITENQLSRSISEDVSGFLSSTKHDTSRGNVMILNLGSFLSRCLQKPGSNDTPTP